MRGIGMRLLWLLTLSVFGLVIAGCARDHRTPDEKIVDAMGATREVVRENVEDEVRTAELLALTDRLEQILREQNEDLHRFTSELELLNSHPATTRKMLAERSATFIDRRRQRRAEAVGVHLQMAERTTPSEWKKIVRRELEAFDAARTLEDQG
jgi:hypothetical protein